MKKVKTRRSPTTGKKRVRVNKRGDRRGSPKYKRARREIKLTVLFSKEEMKMIRDYMDKYDLDKFAPFIRNSVLARVTQKDIFDDN